MKNSVKQKLVFAFLMGMTTTGLVSFTVLMFNLGFTEAFWQIWLKSWSIAFLVIVPLILFISPLIQRFVGFLFQENTIMKREEENVSLPK